MKNNFLIKTKKFLSAIGFIFLFAPAFAQQDSIQKENLENQVYIPPSAVIVSGTVVQNRGPLSGAQIEVYKNNELIDKFKTFKTGFFKLSMEVNKEYVLSFSKKGSITKKILFSTYDVPANATIIREGLFIDMFETGEGAENLTIDEPVGKFYFSKRTQNMEYDKAYTRKMNSKIKNLKNATAKNKDSSK